MMNLGFVAISWALMNKLEVKIKANAISTFLIGMCSIYYLNLKKIKDMGKDFTAA